MTLDLLKARLLTHDVSCHLDFVVILSLQHFDGWCIQQSSLLYFWLPPISPIEMPDHCFTPCIFYVLLVYRRLLLHYYSHEHIFRPLFQCHLFILWFGIICFFCPFLSIITNVTTLSSYTCLCRWPYYLMHSEDSVCQHSFSPLVPIFILFHFTLRIRWAQRPIQPHGLFDSCLLLSSLGPSSITLPFFLHVYHPSTTAFGLQKSQLSNIRCYYMPGIVSGT